MSHFATGQQYLLTILERMVLSHIYVSVRNECKFHTNACASMPYLFIHKLT